MHTETVMIYFDDLDAMGVVHNGRYVTLLERALATYWASAGWPYEAMRLYPPAWTLERTAVADDDVCGTPVPAGSMVAVLPNLIHRNPAVSARDVAPDGTGWISAYPALGACILCGVRPRCMVSLDGDQARGPPSCVPACTVACQDGQP